MFDDLNPNILGLFQKLADNRELLEKFHIQKTLDEQYDFCIKIQSGYTKEEFYDFLDELSSLVKNLKDEELEQVCGGMDFKNFNRKFLATVLSSLTLPEVVSVGATSIHGKANQQYTSVGNNSAYSHKITKNQKREKTQKKKQEEEKGLSVTKRTLVAAGTIGAAIFFGKKILNSSGNSNPISPLPKGQFNAGLTNYSHEICFSNALLQQLYSIKSFRRFVDSINSLEDLQQYDNLNDNLKSDEDRTKRDKEREKERAKTLKKIKEFKKIFNLMKTTKCVNSADMKKYVKIALTGYLNEQQDISECYSRYLCDISDLYQKFLVKDKKDAVLGRWCISCDVLKLLDRPVELSDLFKFNFSRQINNNQLKKLIKTDGNFVDRYSQAYMEKLGYNGSDLEISEGSEKDFFEITSLKKDESEFMHQLIKAITEADENHLYLKYMLSTLYLLLKNAKLPFNFDDKSTSKSRTDCTQKTYIYAAKAISERLKLIGNEDDFKREWNSIFQILKDNDKPNLKFGDIEISKLNNLKADEYSDEKNTQLYNYVRNATVDLFGECWDLKIMPSEGEDTLRSKCVEKNSEPEIHSVDDQIAFFLNRTSVNGKSTVEVKLDSKNDDTNKGFEWDYYGKKYVLSAASVHRGGSMKSGHYYTYKRESDGNWYKYDDEKVYQTDWNVIKDEISKNGVMFTFTDKEAWERQLVVVPGEENKSSSSSALISDGSGDGISDSSSASMSEPIKPADINRRSCMYEKDLPYSKPTDWNNPPADFPSGILEIKKTGNSTLHSKECGEKVYTDIADPILLNEISSESNSIAIVETANSAAMGGEGVDGAISQTMGSSGCAVSFVQDYIKENFLIINASDNRNETGETIAHDSFDIKTTLPGAACVIQAVGPQLNDVNVDTNEWKIQLYSAYFNAFVLAIGQGIKNVIVPPISLGIFCRIENETIAENVGKIAANICLHAINDANKLCLTTHAGNIKVYITDHQCDTPKNTAENAFIKKMYTACSPPGHARSE